MEGRPKPTFTIDTILGMTPSRDKSHCYHDVISDFDNDAMNVPDDVIRSQEVERDNDDETIASVDHYDVTEEQRSLFNENYPDIRERRLPQDLIGQKVNCELNDIQEVDCDPFKGQGHGVSCDQGQLHNRTASVETNENCPNQQINFFNQHGMNRRMNTQKQHMREHDESAREHSCNSHLSNRLVAPQEEIKKRPRTAFSTEQVRTLEGEFQKTKYLSMTRRMEMSRQLGLTEQQIKIWFQNRRTKWKRKYSNDLDIFNQQHYFRFGCIPAFPYPSHVTMVSPEVLRGNPLLVNLNIPQTVLQNHGQ